MGKKGSGRLDVYKMNKDLSYWLDQYIDNASGNSLGAPGWHPNWNMLHGEGRAKTSTSSGITFHIGIRRGSDGHHWSAILVHTVVGNHFVPVEGTLHDWGTVEPTLLEILNYYKKLRGKIPYEPPSQGGNGPDNDGDGPEGGAPSWVKKVMKNDYGAYFYLTKDEEYIECDQHGTPTTGKTASVVPVFFSQAKRVYYYIGRYHFRHPVTVQSDPNKKRTFFKDAQGNSRWCQRVDPKASSTITKRVRRKTRWLRRPAPARRPGA